MSTKSTLKKVAIYTLGAFSGIALSLSVQSFAAEKDKKDNEALPVQTIRTMAEVYGQIKANYYQDKPDAELFEGAMKGMVSDLDPHSEYMDKKGYAEMKESTSGEFGGLGMEIGQEDGFVKVVAPIEDTPAERAGVKSGDFIVKIDNTSTRGLTVSEAVKKMRGKPGTKITLTLSRKNADKPIVVNLTRAIICLKKTTATSASPNSKSALLPRSTKPHKPLSKKTKVRSKASSSTCATTRAACSTVQSAYPQPSCSLT